MKGGFLSGQVLEPYAEAFLDLAKSDNELKGKLSEDVDTLLNLLKESPQLQEFLGSPVVKAEDKIGVLQQIAGDQLHPYTMNFLRILVDRGRIVFLEGICLKYQELLRELDQTVLAEVSSAIELSEAQQESVREKVKSLTGANQVELETKIDPDVIGGVIIKVGSQIFDASLKGQLRRIGMTLTS
ncbi:ATP synthase F1 subunit delta [Moorena producens JHB]|uniref:ATP synthase subunit delta n=1 Tax=Moorena producens (strain JHB) TaxID=1454205 RepID=A0A1D9FXN2_MOOP1|nr:ATP synthase F1 subunit delta [Moorena producens]AOY80129.1 ATP synthase F1 subunit delta [Moorena producens JHB]